MLDAGSADTPSVVHRALNLFSLFCCALVCASFLMFARDQVAGASQRQQAAVTGGAPAPAPGVRGAVARRPVVLAHTGQPRAFIDSTASALTSPFDNIVTSTNAWVQHGLPAVLALVVYGLGFGFIARYARGGA